MSLPAAVPPAAVPSAVLSAFERAIGRFLDSLNAEEKKSFHRINTVDEVWVLITNLEAEQSTRKSLRNMKRLEPFINCLSQYAKVIEVLIQAKPEIGSLLWGPLKLLLQLSGGYIESFEKLLDAFQKIGENLPRFSLYATIFCYSERIQYVISLLYEDILDFYRRTLKFFRRGAWKILFSFSWNDFESRFRNILLNIKSHQQLIDNEACAEDIARAQISREFARERFEETTRERGAKRKKQCSDWLSPADVDVSKDNALQLRTPRTSKWLLRSVEIQEWLAGDCNLWLTGKPGAGKTILTASVLDYFESQHPNPPPVLYFFCSYKEPDKNTCLAILRSFIYQMILHDEQLIPYVYAEYVASPHSINSLKCKTILSSLISASSPSTSSHIYVIIDGLDELPSAERATLLPILSRYLVESPFNGTVRLFVASQDLPDIRKFLLKKTKRIAVGNKNKKDIRTYIESATDDLFEELELEEAPDMREHIINSLSGRADGMFLWVRLVIKGLLSKVTIKQITETLNNLPKGLDQAYERILDRINSLDQEQRALAKKVLRWMTCATRALTMRELEDACAIISGHITVHNSERPLRSQLRNICGPIVEIVGEDTLVFVHFSAKEYLLSPHSGPFVDRGISQLEIATTCTNYFAFRCFDEDVGDEEATALILNGDLRLYDYAQGSWVKHILEAYRRYPQCDTLSDPLRRVFEKHSTQKAKQVLSSQSMVPRSENAGHPGLRMIVEYRRQLGRKIGGGTEALEAWCNHNNPLVIERANRRLRKMLEDILEGDSNAASTTNPDDVETLRRLYGQKLYKCNRQSCPLPTIEGFETALQRKKHEDRHDLPFKCPDENCTYQDIGLPSKVALQRHIKDYHADLAKHRQNPPENTEVLDLISISRKRSTRSTAPLTLTRPADIDTKARPTYEDPPDGSVFGTERNLGHPKHECWFFVVEEGSPVVGGLSRIHSLRKVRNPRNYDSHKQIVPQQIEAAYRLWEKPIPDVKHADGAIGFPKWAQHLAGIRLLLSDYRALRLVSSFLLLGGRTASAVSLLHRQNVLREYSSKPLIPSGTELRKLLLTSAEKLKITRYIRFIVQFANQIEKEVERMSPRETVAYTQALNEVLSNSPIQIFFDDPQTGRGVLPYSELEWKFMEYHRLQRMKDLDHFAQLQLLTLRNNHRICGDSPLLLTFASKDPAQLDDCLIATDGRDCEDYSSIFEVKTWGEARSRAYRLNLPELYMSILVAQSEKIAVRIGDRIPSGLPMMTRQELEAVFTLSNKPSEIATLDKRYPLKEHIPIIEKLDFLRPPGDWNPTWGELKLQVQSCSQWQLYEYFRLLQLQQEAQIRLQLNPTLFQSDKGEGKNTCCHCNETSDEMLLACDGEKCPRKWFHLSCVGLSWAPRHNEKWYCDSCFKKRGIGRSYIDVTDEGDADEGDEGEDQRKVAPEHPICIVLDGDEEEQHRIASPDPLGDPSGSSFWSDLLPRSLPRGEPQKAIDDIFEPDQHQSRSLDPSRDPSASSSWNHFPGPIILPDPSKIVSDIRDNGEREQRQSHVISNITPPALTGTFSSKNWGPIDAEGLQ